MTSEVPAFAAHAACTNELTKPGARTATKLVGEQDLGDDAVLSLHTDEQGDAADVQSQADAADDKLEPRLLLSPRPIASNASPGVARARFPLLSLPSEIILNALNFFDVYELAKVMPLVSCVHITNACCTCASNAVHMLGAHAAANSRIPNCAT